MAAYDFCGQAGRVGADNAHAVNVHAQQLLGTHVLGQIQRHIVAPAAVDVFDAVDLTRAQRGKTRAGRQQVVLQLAVGDLVNGAADAAHRAQLSHDQTKPNGGVPRRVLVNIAVDGFAQRFDVQATAAHHIHKKVVQGFLFGGGGQLQHIVQLHAAPDVLGLLHLAHREQKAVQCADAGTGNDIRRPTQLLQSAVDAHMVASFGTAAGQHQRADGSRILFHWLTSWYTQTL